VAITSTQSKNPASVVQICHGAYIDTGTIASTPMVITTGFKPRYVKVVNTNASGDVMLEWFEGMTAGYAIKTAIDGTRSMITSLGITVSANGFTVGDDTDLRVTSEQLYWQASN
jgi:hypothetical protein